MSSRLATLSRACGVRPIRRANLFFGFVHVVSPVMLRRKSGPAVVALLRALELLSNPGLILQVTKRRIDDLVRRSGAADLFRKAAERMEAEVVPSESDP